MPGITCRVMRMRPVTLVSTIFAHSSASPASNRRRPPTVVSGAVDEHCDLAEARPAGVLRCSPPKRGRRRRARAHARRSPMRPTPRVRCADPRRSPRVRPPRGASRSPLRSRCPAPVTRATAPARSSSPIVLPPGSLPRSSSPSRGMPIPSAGRRGSSVESGTNSRPRAGEFRRWPDSVRAPRGPLIQPPLPRGRALGIMDPRDCRGGRQRRPGGVVRIPQSAANSRYGANASSTWCAVRP